MQSNKLISSMIELLGGKTTYQSTFAQVLTNDLSSLEGFCLFTDRHVEDLKCYNLIDDGIR